MERPKIDLERLRKIAAEEENRRKNSQTYEKQKLSARLKKKQK